MLLNLCETVLIQFSLRVHSYSLNALISAVLHSLISFTFVDLSFSAKGVGDLSFEYKQALKPVVSYNSNSV